MKKRATTPKFKGLATKSTLIVAAAVMAISLPASIAPLVSARDYEAEIRAVQEQIDQYNAEARKLSKKADTLANELAKLASEKATIQAKIDLSQAKHDKLKADIAENKQKIIDNQDALGETLNDMSIAESVSQLEMLASSKSIGDFVDKQADRTVIRNNLSQTIEDIDRLKKELEKKEIEVARVLADQKNQRGVLVEKENERQRLMAETKGKEASYQSLSKEAKAKKDAILQAQREAIANAYGGGGGGNIAPGSLPAYANWSGTSCYVDNAGWSHRGYNGRGGDPAGYGCNQCVSYTAWKMGQEIGYVPSYWGNANMWPASARAAGFRVSSTPPQPGERALGVMMPGAYGHIVNVDSVNSDGTLNISQYNEWLQQKYYETGRGFGHFSTRTGVSPSTYGQYIYY